MEVSLCHIVQYIGEGVRPLKEGEQVFLAGHVNLIHVQNEVKELRVVAECLQSSKLAGASHKIEISIKDNIEEINNWNCGCSCKAGLGGKCKHIVAVLIAINRLADTEHLSCTDVNQKWGKRKRESILEVVPMDEFCHVPKVELPQNLPEKNFLQMFLIQAPNSEAAIHYKKGMRAAINSEHNTKLVDDQRLWYVESIYKNAAAAPYVEILNNCSDLKHCLDSCCIQTYNKIYPCEATDICQKTLNDKKVWMEERKYRITASRCYSLFTYSLNEWEEKINKYFFGQTFENEATRYGIAQEKFAREAYIKHTKNKVIEVGLCVCQGEPWLGVSPDGIIFNDKNPIKSLEIKCPVAGKTKTIFECLGDLKYLKKDEGKFNLRKKCIYYCQIQMGLCCLGLSSCDLCIYSSFDSSIYIIEVIFDYNFCKELLPKLKEIFFTKMLHALCQVNK